MTDNTQQQNQRQPGATDDETRLDRQADGGMQGENRSFAQDQQRQPTEGDMQGEGAQAQGRQQTEARGDMQGEGEDQDEGRAPQA